MALDISSIAGQLVKAIEDNPQLAQELVSAPSKTVEKVTGEKDGVDMTELVQTVLKMLGEKDLDLSHVDLSKIDLSDIDISKLDLKELSSIAKGLNIDLSNLSGVAGLAEGLLGKGGVGSLLGGLFGGK